LRIVRLPDEALTANEEARDGIVKTIIIDHWPRTTGVFRPSAGLRDMSWSGCGIRRFRFRVAVQHHWRRAGAMQQTERLEEATLGTSRGDVSLAGLLGTRSEPEVRMASVHHIMKQVAGVPNFRPAWFFDVTQQGESLADVGTHLVDRVHSTLFPEQICVRLSSPQTTDG
jgi:hypothetical protein